MKKRIVAVTPGDPDGVGPEITWKTVQRREYPHARAALLCIGARAPFEKLGARIIEADENDLRAGAPPPREIRPHIWLLPAPVHAPRGRFLPGYQCGWAIEKATRLAQDRAIAA